MKAMLKAAAGPTQPAKKHEVAPGAAEVLGSRCARRRGMSFPRTRG